MPQTASITLVALAVVSGSTWATMGDPLNAVALMANTAECGVTLKGGMLLMTGSFMRHVAMVPGDEALVEFTRMGSVSARFAKWNGAIPPDVAVTEIRGNVGH